MRSLKRDSCSVDEELESIDESGDDPHFDFDFEEKDSISDLKQELKSLKTQVKHLKRMMVLDVFGSKGEFLDFFSDIW